MVKAGDFVKVISGPAYSEGGPETKGKVETVAPDGVATVRVASGGTWSFMVSDLAILPRKTAR